MKSILAPIEMQSTIESVLTTALLLGRRFDSYIEGIALAPDMSDFVAFEMNWTIEDQIALKESADQMRRQFEAFMTRNAIPALIEGASGLSYGFAGDTTFRDGQAASHARVFDVTVLGRPDTGPGGHRMATAEAALFESGRPVLLAPPESPKTLGETIIIAWNQSMESARATAFAMPLLLRSKKVFILTFEAHNVEGPSAERLAQMLAGHGVAVEVVRRLGKKRAAGVAYLEDGASLGGDLMIKGAYTQSRLRQMIFGGATAHILGNARMPVLMAN